MNPELLPALVVAYLGDAIFEVYVREYLIITKNILKPDLLQKEAIKYVSASSQAGFIKKAIKEGWLTSKEIEIYKRGRNTKGRKVNNMSVITHNQSSGFESLIGHLYLIDDKNRIEEIFELYKKYVDEENV